MSQELHYTSVPRGLKPGSRGFCTVGLTPHMPGPLVDRLEALSGYQPVFPPHDPSAPLNPIVFSHLRLTIGGKAVSVLSRIGPAGLDYSGRPNKYAHHVVLEGSERPEGGPAWLLSQPGFMQGAWDGEPREIPVGRTPLQGDRPPGMARAWQALTGDGGWAGVLAESFLADPRRTVFLVFRPGMDLLPLFVEALALLPASHGAGTSISVRISISFRREWVAPGAVCWRDRRMRRMRGGCLMRWSSICARRWAAPRAGRSSTWRGPASGSHRNRVRRWLRREADGISRECRRRRA